MKLVQTPRTYTSETIHSGVIPLGMAPEGVALRVVGVSAGRSAMRRLAELGLVVGSDIRIIKSSGSGPVLLEVKGSRIALGRGISMKLFVEVL